MIVEAALDPRFSALRDAFAAHFERDDEFRELGAGVVVYEHGRKVVDLHGGWQDPARRASWTTPRRSPPGGRNSARPGRRRSRWTR